MTRDEPIDLYCTGCKRLMWNVKRRDADKMSEAHAWTSDNCTPDLVVVCT